MGKYPLAEYEFYFGNDPDSCFALRDLILRGWTIQSLKHEDGYTWFLLWKEFEREEKQ